MVGLLGVAAALEEQQQRLVPGRHAGAHHGLDARADVGPDLRPHLARRAPERPRVLLAERVAPVRVVAEERQLRAPRHPHREARREDDLDDGLQAPRPLLRRAERVRRPVDGSRSRPTSPPAARTSRMPEPAVSASRAPPARNASGSSTNSSTFVSPDISRIRCDVRARRRRRPRSGSRACARAAAGSTISPRPLESMNVTSRRSSTTPASRASCATSAARTSGADQRSISPLATTTTPRVALLPAHVERPLLHGHHASLPSRSPSNRLGLERRRADRAFRPHGTVASRLWLR